MAEEIKIVASAVGFDQVDKALDNTTKSLEETSQAATQAGKALGSQLKAGSAQAQQSITNLSRVVSDAPYGFIGIANNINPLVESFGRLKSESGSVGGALKSLIGGLSGPGGLGLAFAAVTTAITFAQIGFQAWTRTTQKAKETVDETAKALSSIQNSVASEAGSVASLVAILENETETRQRKLSAIKELQKLNPEIFAQLKLEGNTVVGLTSAYQAYIDNLKNVVTAKLLQSRIEKEITELLKVQGTTLTGNEKKLKENAKTFEIGFLKNQIAYLKTLKDQPGVYQKIQDAEAALRKAESGYSDAQRAEIDTLNKRIIELTKNLSEVSKGIKVNDFTEKVKKVKEELDKLKIKPVEVKPIVISNKKIQDKIVKDLSNIIPPDRISIPITFLPAKTGLIELTDAVNNFMQDAAFSIGTTFSDILSQAITQGISFGDAFRGVFNAIGGAISALGTELIKIGTLAVVAKIALNSLFANPYAAIAVGIALAALGKAIQSTTSKQRFAVGTRYAPGGMALVGERGPEMINLPRGSQVIPAAQTAKMMGGIGGAIEVFGMLRGQDIYFSNKKYGQTYKRTT